MARMSRPDVSSPSTPLTLHVRFLTPEYHSGSSIICTLVDLNAGTPSTELAALFPVLPTSSAMNTRLDPTNSGQRGEPDFRDADGLPLRVNNI